MDTTKLEALITAFLAINPEPADHQFHALAEAAGIDKEELEAVSYRMLSEEKGLDQLSDPVQAFTRDEEILQDDYDPAMTPTDDIPINDGGPGVNEVDTQTDTLVDGVGVTDQGMDVNNQDALLTDGIPVPVGAAARLKALA